MLRLNLSKDAARFIAAIDRKHAGQIFLRIIGLMENPRAQDVRDLKGTDTACWRADVGEFRVIFTVEGDELRVILIGKRNDDEIYKTMSRRKL